MWFDPAANDPCLKIVHLLVRHHDESDLQLTLPIPFGEEEMALIDFIRGNALQLAWVYTNSISNTSSNDRPKKSRCTLKIGLPDVDEAGAKYKKELIPLLGSVTDEVPRDQIVGCCFTDAPSLHLQ